MDDRADGAFGLGQQRHNNKHKSMAELQPRYEYRVWADSLGHVKDKLHLFCTALPTQASAETYLISAATDKSNAKIRNGRMDIKVLLERTQGLELWKPVLDAQFPLDRVVIAEQVFPNLELHASDLRRPRYSLEQFLAEVMRSNAQIATVAITKERTRFRREPCLAEFTSVAVGKVVRETVAVESIESEPLLQMIRQMQIADMPNQNYVVQLKQILAHDPNAAVN